MTARGQYAADTCTLPVTETDERYAVAVAAPILSEGDVLGCVLFAAARGGAPPEKPSVSSRRRSPAFSASRWRAESHRKQKKTSGRTRRSFAMRAAIARPVRRRCALILRRDERADRGEQW